MEEEYEDVYEDVEVEETETPEETPPAKEIPTETPEAKLARLDRQAARLRKQLGQEPEPTTPAQKSSDLDYGQKAFLIANDVRGNEEVALVKDIMANTGKSLDDVLESKYFQAELKEMREAKVAREAIPSGTKRSAQSARSSVDFWIAKGELPPADQRELRQEVVNARIKSEANTNIFTSNPVVK